LGMRRRRNAGSRFNASIAARMRSRDRQRRAEVDIASRAEVLRRNDIAPDLKLEWRDVDALHLPKRVLRQPPPQQLASVARSISTFGFVTPVLIKRDGEIIDGATRVHVARELGLREVVCIVADHLNETENQVVAGT
jgi:hypothetical protein